MSLLQRVRNRLKGKAAKWQLESLANNEHERELKRLVGAAHKVVDLGCGANPIAGATDAVDLFIAPTQRGAGKGPTLDVGALEKRGIHFFNQSIDVRLPFEDGACDFAHCSHVIEHVENPGAACDEQMRVARSGLLRCPAAMIEFLTGRPYHKWLVLQRGGRVLFIEKAPHDYAIFATYDGENMNPFEALLDWDGQAPATPSRGIIGRLKKRLQELFYSRAEQSELNLFWERGFFWTELRCDGSVRSGGRAGKQWWFDAQGKRHESGA